MQDGTGMKACKKAGRNGTRKDVERREEDRGRERSREREGGRANRAKRREEDGTELVEGIEGHKLLVTNLK